MASLTDSVGITSLRVWFKPRNTLNYFQIFSLVTRLCVGNVSWESFLGYLIFYDAYAMQVGFKKHGCVGKRLIIVFINHHAKSIRLRQRNITG